MRFTSKVLVSIIVCLSVQVSVSEASITKTGFWYGEVVENPKVYSVENNPLLVLSEVKETPKGISAKKFTARLSAYTAAADECGKSNGITASGKKVAAKRTLACPRGYAFGTKVYIEGMGEYTCEDRGGAIKGNKFDVYVPTKSEAFAFGRQNRQVTVIQ
jgi:3D (Asp-Asp-Asp) domain-containing protein